MNLITKNRYKERIEVVIKHIYKELAKPTENGLSLNRLSEVACFSKYHFHRIFLAVIGMNTNQFIQRLRLKKSSYQLAFHPELKIIDIALIADYENHESFSRAFKKTYQQTPSQFRQKPNWQHWSERHSYQLTQENPNVEITICQFPETLIASLKHLGSPKLLNQTISQFIKWRKTSGESPIATTDTFGLAFNDPTSTPTSEFRFDVCSSVSRPVNENPYGVIMQTIPGGRCARITHHGSHDLMYEKIRYLYNSWVFEHNEELRNFPCFFQYRNLFPQVSEHELITDIFLPLK